MRLRQPLWFLSMTTQYKEIERLVAVSDIHVDDAANMRWIESLPERKREAIVVAGDVSDRFDRLEHVFRCLTEKYGAVFFTFGNHDAWVRTDEEFKDSVEKIDAIAELARRTGVATEAAVIGQSRRCVVAPLTAWYHSSFDTEPNVTRWKGIPSAKLVMTDFRRCKWPDGLREEALAKAMDDRNEDIETILGLARDDLVTFSHFLPRVELLPEKRYLFLPTLTQAVGSRFLGDRVKRLNPDVHIFGHTHINWDATIDGVRYVQAALAYPNEWRTRPASLEIGNLNAGHRAPVVIWESRSGVIANTYSTRWADHYRRFPRVPDLTHVLPPYTARLYKPLPGSAVKDVHDHVPPFDNNHDALLSGGGEKKLETRRPATMGGSK
mmetsp:Transcript_6086/g.19851  ORF Transcript_6086/g.19851 Transcript_6086/m.19851 type:complete len:381 (+) Transcript_6086:99-1241(+)